MSDLCLNYLVKMFIIVKGTNLNEKEKKYCKTTNN